MIAGRKIALVTGASRGIGAAVAEALAADDCFVYVNYLSSKDKAEALARKIGGAAVCCNVSMSGEVRRMMRQIESESGKLDILVNNAGVSLYGLFTDFTEDEVKRLYDINLFGTLNCSRAALPMMIREKQGSIINISSVWGRVGASCEVDYSASKAAIIGFTKALSKETAPSGVRVNCVAPGVIETDMLSMFDENSRHDLCEDTPLQRLGTVGDVANAVCFLASEKASFITGQILDVGGGFGV